MRCVLVLLISLAAVSPLAAAPKVVDLNLPPGFVAEQIYEVPNRDQGSWICLALDDRGRLIASDQSGALYRITLPDPAGSSAPTVETIDLEIGMAMGLLYAFDSLYVMVNGDIAQGAGLYRLRDTDGDDHFDRVELLRRIIPPGKPGAGHGPHAVVLGPDGESLYLVCGNMSGFPEGGFDSSRVPQNWDEDQLLPRIPDTQGHAADTMAPGGWIARTDPDGRHWELVCSGFRNIYDAAFNTAGDLFTFDADMEFDLGTPWYRPTRLCHVVSGGEFGWRNGSGKWPEFYPDSLPPVRDIGLGSPTGVTFGYDTNFPEPYRDGLFLCDWSYGRIYLADVARSGASYRGTHRLFASGAPLPVVDLVAHPADGALYFVTGGRGVQSHLYRIRYTGADGTAAEQESVTVLTEDPKSDRLHALRRELESLHSMQDGSVIERVWPHLSHDDRFIRFAARIALEHQPVEWWQERVLALSDPQATIVGAVALARCGENVGEPLLATLMELPLAELSAPLQLDLLRAYGLVFIRQGRPNANAAAELGTRLLKRFPSGNSDLDRELSRLLAYLETDGAIEELLDRIDASDSSADQMHFAAMLRTIDDGWSIEQRERLFRWIASSRGLVGGRSNGAVVNQIRQDIEATLSAEERTALADVLAEWNRPVEEVIAEAEPRPFVRKWTTEELIADADTTWSDVLGGDRDLERGRRLFTAATCNRCHRVAGEGGVIGPDLTGVARRFSPHDLVEAVIDPGKSVPHDFQSVSILTRKGKVVVGQIVNMTARGISVRTDSLRPWKTETIPERDVEEVVPSPTSLMPTGLFDTFEREEVLDLLAWLAEASASEESLTRAP